MSFAESFAIIYFNMAGEMVYIIDQRLTAQAVEPTKANKVLNDITLAMFNSKLISEVFKPHNTITFALLRSVFEKLAHSSIMRLNEQSMNKLFDLMVMVVKYQLVSCAKPSDLLLITDNHLASLQEMVGGNGDNGGEGGFPETAELVGTVRSQFLFHYQNRYDLLQLQLIRYYLLNLLKDIHTRVSIFLREGVQTADGRFTIPTNQVVVECECLIPGQIRYFSTSTGAIAAATAAVAAISAAAAEGDGAESGGGGSEVASKVSKSGGHHAVGIGLAAIVELTEHFEVGAQFVVNEQRTTLGLNIYRKEAAREEQEADGEEPQLQSAGGAASSCPRSTTNNEIDLLAMLICKAPTASAADGDSQQANSQQDQFKFEFLEDQKDSPAKYLKDKPSGQQQQHHFEASSSQQHLMEIIADLSSLDVAADTTSEAPSGEAGGQKEEKEVGGQGRPEDEDVDYLQLMDS